MNLGQKSTVSLAPSHKEELFLLAALAAIVGFCPGNFVKLSDPIALYTLLKTVAKSGISVQDSPIQSSSLVQQSPLQWQSFPKHEQLPENSIAKPQSLVIVRLKAGTCKH